MVTRQLQVERRTGKVRRPKTDVLPLSHATTRPVAAERMILRQDRNAHAMPGGAVAQRVERWTCNQQVKS